MVQKIIISVPFKTMSLRVYWLARDVSFILRKTLKIYYITFPNYILLSSLIEVK